jgi:hypothetical protein
VRRAALAPIALLIGACGTQDFAFDGVDAAIDAPIEATPEASVDVAQPPTGCTTDDDCGLPDLHCDPSSGQCVACIANDQCLDPNYGVCDYALNLCVECGADIDCPGGTCEPTTLRCILSCADAGLCPDGLLCEHGSCVRCTSNASCTDDRGSLLCDTAVGQCVECLADSDCTPAICDRTTGRCVQCLNGQSCHDGEECDPLEHVCVDVRTPFPDDAQPPAIDGGMRMPL